MARRFDRAEILDRLKRSLSEGRPILAAGCSVGIIAKCAEIGGADLIMVYSSGRARIRGLQTALEENSNVMTLGMLDEIAYVVKETPIIAGVDATEPPVGCDLEERIEMFLEKGFSGIINFPTYGFFDDPEWRREREEQGVGFSREVEMIRVARARDVFTMAYVFFPQDATEMARAGVDCLVAHAGGTAGGLVGFDSLASPLEEVAQRVQAMIEEARKVRPDLICLAHGGTIVTPEDTRLIYERTDAVGFVGASSIERIPVENAVMGIVREFKSIPLRSGGTDGSAH